jgi:hypothetical protein
MDRAGVRRRGMRAAGTLRRMPGLCCRFGTAEPQPKKTLMGFDKDSSKPVVNLHKKTTQFNVWMVIGVLAFLIVMGLVAHHIRQHPQKAVQDVKAKAAEPGAGQ